MAGYILAAVAFAVALTVVLIAWRLQQRTVRRLIEAVEHLGEVAPGRPRSELAMARLERSVQRVRERDDRVHQAELRLELALSEMTQGAVVCDERGVVVFRNAYAQSFVGARHGEALVEAAILELLEVARGGSELVGAIAVIDDITETQRIDSIRRDFVANVSHELKTPIGALALLAETLAGESDAGIVQRLSERVRNESFRVSNMVDDLLTLSRIEGNDSPNVDDFGIDLLVRDCVDRVHPVAERRSVIITVGAVDGSLRFVGDRRQIASALSNLLENAVKYSESGAPVDVRVSTSEHEMAIVVQDHGIGIPTSELERIFERFYRVDKARSRETGGSGLGLSIARHVARNHGGDITVVSREGEGSTFALLLPRPTAFRICSSSRTSPPSPTRSPSGSPARGSGSPLPRTAPRRSRSSVAIHPTSCCSMSCCPSSRGSTCAGSCARPRTCRSSWSPRRARRSTQLSASKWGPMTTSPSRTACASSWRECAPTCDAPRAAHKPRATTTATSPTKC
jgi:two-component system sensor histidine kinase SenX3